MRLPAPLQEGRLLRRYQRFFADVELAGGEVVTAHTPNTGSMTQCAVPGHRVLLSRAANPARKLAWTLELIEVNDAWVDTNTQRTNRVAEEALCAGRIAELVGYQVRPEFGYRDSRLDFLLRKPDEAVLVEVKSVTLCDGGTARFPDAVTQRGQRHLRELALARLEGYRAVVLFVVQRSEARAFAPADGIDPEYGRVLREVVATGVEALAYRTCVTPTEVFLERALPVRL